MRIGKIEDGLQGYKERLRLIDSAEMLIEGMIIMDVDPELEKIEVLNLVLKRFDELISEEKDVRILIKLYYKHKDNPKLSFLISPLKVAIDKRLLSAFNLMKPILNVIATILAPVYAFKGMLFGKKQ